MTRTERLVYRLLMTAGVLSLLVFYGWWLRPQNLPDNLDGPGQLVDIAIFAALTGVLSHRIFMDVYVWVVARKIRPLTEPPEPEAGLRVAFITTFVPGSEGLDLLARTLPAMVAVDYPHDTWLLDEGADEDARMLCERLGVRYFTRRGVSDYNQPAGPFTARTKGGNHNAWHDTHGEDYDIVAQIDTDFPPHQDYLNRTLGHFRDPEVGWVISPQIYGNTDSLITRGAAEQQYTFYGPVLRGLAGRGLASMLGANHVVRTAALHDIGLYAGHITEDLLTGMRLHAAGWRSEYVPEVLAVGEGPDTWRAYFSQQRRWAFGCMHVLRKHSTDLLPRMSWTGRSLYLSLMQGYFTGLVGAVGSLLLLAYFVGGVEISRLSLVELADLRDPPVPDAPGHQAVAATLHRPSGGRARADALGRSRGHRRLAGVLRRPAPGPPQHHHALQRHAEGSGQQGDVRFTQPVPPAPVVGSGERHLPGLHPSLRSRLRGAHRVGGPQRADARLLVRLRRPAARVARRAHARRAGQPRPGPGPADGRGRRGHALTGRRARSRPGSAAERRCRVRPAPPRLPPIARLRSR